MIQPQEYQRAFGPWLHSQEWHYHVTLTFGDPKRRRGPNEIAGSVMRAKLRRFDKELSRTILGKRYWQFADRRPEGIFFVEKRLTNPHWDGLIRLPEPEWQCDQFLWHLEATWSRVIRSGTASAKPYDAETKLSTGLPVHAYYPTKELLKHDHKEHFTTLAELRTRPI